MQNTKNKLSIHGHFYQPPRVNPLTNAIPDDGMIQGWSGGKYKNWDEVIDDQCYRPNADEGNFELISFDLFRALAEWLEANDKITYDKIISADQHNYITYGYGNAFAYPYDHAILPLLTEEDIDIEVYWGIRDFFKRYGHMPISLWLPETGVDLKTLRVLEANGIRFVILAPWQADDGNLDTSQLYSCNLGHGKALDLFFYDSQLSGDLSFNNVEMENADKYVADYLPNVVKKSYNLAALDGERFGHHLKGGEQFLRQMLRDLFNNATIETTNVNKQYFSFETKPTIKIFENSAWSCHHGGLKRWQGDCDCCFDDDHGQRVNGAWKTALLSAFRVLAAKIDLYFNDYARDLIVNVQTLKKEYIKVMLGEMQFHDFLVQHQIRPLSAADENKMRVLLDMQKYKLASFTSDAFYFADLDRPEPRINILNAKKALSMFKECGDESTGVKMEEEFLHQIEEIYSNFTGKNGKDLYYEDGTTISS
jgi:hypothetical protein